MKLASPPLNLLPNKRLAELTTLGIGGIARFYVEVKTIEALRSALLLSKELKMPFFILGKGSNCLFDDRGFNGCVIHNKIDFIQPSGDGIYSVGAGYSFSLLGVQTARQGWSGLEFASGIPASVGGALFMNAGANGAETKDPLLSLDFMDEEGKLHTYLKNDLEFRYRHSSLQHLKGAIASATFSLTPSIAARGKQLEIVHYRQKTQPYGDKSAGCIFKNPLDTSAGRLIDACGLKGFRIGGAEVSKLHANFLINAASATAEDFQKLIAEVQKKVREETGILLENEVRIIPYDISS